MGDRWVSPPIYTQVQEPGKPLRVEARAQGLVGQVPVAVHPEWSGADPDILSVSPNFGDQVVITLMNTGYTALEVNAGGVTKQLLVEVKLSRDDIMVVEISQ